MNQNDVDAFLEHHGIKGQKWGVRRNRTTNNSVTISRDHRTAQQLRKKKVSTLSNKELKIANERANLQKNFRQLNPTPAQKASAQVRSVLKALGVGTSAVALLKFSQSPEGKQLQEKAQKWLAGRAARKAMATSTQLAFDF